MTEKKKIVIYARYSSDRQTEQSKGWFLGVLSSKKWQNVCNSYPAYYNLYKTNVDFLFKQ